MTPEPEKTPAGPLAALIGVLFYLGELFFGVRILAEITLSGTSEPNYLALLTRAILAAVFFSFGCMLLVYYQYQITPAASIDEWRQPEHSKPSLPLWVSAFFIFIVAMHLLGTLIVVGTLSYRLILAENVSLNVYYLNALLAVILSALASALTGLLRFPRWQFALALIPAMLFQMFFWILRDLFAISPMALDSWVGAALMLFLVDGLVVMVFAIPMLEDKKTPADAPPKKFVRYSAGDNW